MTTTATASSCWSVVLSFATRLLDINSASTWLVENELLTTQQPITLSGNGFLEIIESEEKFSEEVRGCCIMEIGGYCKKCVNIVSFSLSWIVSRNSIGIWFLLSCWGYPVCPFERTVIPLYSGHLVYSGQKHFLEQRKMLFIADNLL